MRLGIYGGTFDPIHNAHLIIAECAVKELNLDTLLFMPSAISPHKSTNTISKSELRYKMVETAIQGYPQFQVSDYEIKKKGISFTIDTIQFFVNKYNLAKQHLYLVIGQDNFIDFDKWKSPDLINELCTIVVAARSGKSIKETNNFRFLNTPLLAHSSTNIRNRVQNGLSIEELVPKSVANIIYENHLYC